MPLQTKQSKPFNAAAAPAMYVCERGESVAQTTTVYFDTELIAVGEAPKYSSEDRSILLFLFVIHSHQQASPSHSILHLRLLLLLMMVIRRVKQ